MKLEHSINGLSKVSFTTIPVINPVTGEPTGLMKDNWEDIPNSTAKAIEELQKRVEKLEAEISIFHTEGKIEELLEEVSKKTRRMKNAKPVSSLNRIKVSKGAKVPEVEP